MEGGLANSPVGKPRSPHSVFIFVFVVLSSHVIPIGFHKYYSIGTGVFSFNLLVVSIFELLSKNLLFIFFIKK